jgi:hypothetical protein
VVALGATRHGGIQMNTKREMLRASANLERGGSVLTGPRATGTGAFFDHLTPTGAIQDIPCFRLCASGCSQRPIPM